MKINEIPEKIYVSTDPFGFLHAYDSENHPPIVEEYVHKDAFIEKACEYISQHQCEYIDLENFKNFMKGG